MKAIVLSEATNQQINWLVAQKEGLTVVVDNGQVRFPPGQFSDEELYDPCSNPGQSWPIIDREDISTIRCSTSSRDRWAAEKGDQSPTCSTEHQQHDAMFQFDVEDLSYGPTSLVAAMRCHLNPGWPERPKQVFEVPDELVLATQEKT